MATTHLQSLRAVKFALILFTASTCLAQNPVGSRRVMPEAQAIPDRQVMPERQVNANLSSELPPKKLIKSASGCNFYTRQALDNLSGDYAGECVNGLAAGKGVLTLYSNGATVFTMTGNFADGILNGPGEIKYKDEAVNGGNYNDGLLQGQGYSRSLRTGLEFNGAFANGRPHGMGTTTFRNGDKWVGEWKNGIRDGEFTMTWANGERYVGMIKDKGREGRGTHWKPPDIKYEGEWRNDKPNGYGTETGRMGKYVGSFKDGLYHGQGVFSSVDGRKSEGEWHTGKLNGPGKIYAKNGSLTYDGIFKDDKAHGYGTSIDGAGKYIGGFSNGERHGSGTLFDADGHKIEGQWRDGKFDGDVKFYGKNGLLIAQETWINGKRLDFPEILSTYKANQARFHALFKGKSINGKATVQAIRADFMGSGAIFFIDLESNASGFTCSTRNRDVAAGLNRGQEVFFKGNIRDVTFNTPSLENCEFSFGQK
jgi:hypothetical protein